ncbi:MAG: glycoside hydrolase family 88 protein [Candidatus Latescibacterota bacterium]
MNRLALIFVLTLTASTWAALPAHSANPDRQFDRCFRFGVSQLKKSVESVRDPLLLPIAAKPDSAWKNAGMYDWRSGFFPGLLWYAYEFSKDEALKAAAVRWTEALEPVKNYSGNHDVGFMIFCSYGNAYRLTKNEAYRQVILQAAKSLITRYNPKVGLIQSWNANSRWKYPVIVDNMMNLELLFWASKNGGSRELYTIAETHALNTMKNHVREDGSTFHVVDYDPETGEIRAKNTAQGFADGSCWSRGHAWGIYGFTMTYRETKNPEFLKTACRLADYFIAHLPEDKVPYWDFQAPGIPNEPRDSSAGSIAASGMLELSALVKDKKTADKYRHTALDILASLCSSRYLAEGTASPAILLHATGAKPHNADIDVSLIYGDYYFLEALLRYKRGI